MDVLNSSISSLNFICSISPECNREKCLINILSNNTLSKSQILSINLFCTENYLYPNPQYSLILKNNLE